jgi:hypothetical protein
MRSRPTTWAANPRNPLKITDQQIVALRKSLQDSRRLASREVGNIEPGWF